MPNTHTSLVSLFEDIADAIRAKTGGSASIVADNFPTEIANIPAGGGADWNDVCDRSFSGDIVANTASRVAVNTFAGSSITSFTGSTVDKVWNYAFQNCTSLSSVSLPNCSNVYYNAFEGCTSLSSISLPKASIINGSAFKDSGLKVITIGYDGTSLFCRGFSGAFSGTPLEQMGSDCHIYVPSSQVQTYCTDSFWGTYSGIISAIPNS